MERKEAPVELLKRVSNYPAPIPAVTNETFSLSEFIETTKRPTVLHLFTG
jgi:hypothetical protein